MQAQPPSLRRRIVLFAFVAILGLGIDLATKAWTFSRPDLFLGEPWWLWDGHVGIQLSLNEGALFGIGQGKTWLFAIFSLIAAVAIPTWLFYYGAARSTGMTVALGLVMAGVLGNLYDRLGLPGLVWETYRPERAGEAVYAVRDWILFAWRWDADWQNRVVWPNFNLADSYLVCSIPVLLWLSWNEEA